jgi:hypothetical protein
MRLFSFEIHSFEQPSSIRSLFPVLTDISVSDLRIFPMINRYYFPALSVTLICIAVGFIPDKGHRKSLFNGKDLTGWDTYIGPPFDSVQNKFSGSPAGLNNDSRRIFSVVTADGKGALRVSGERFGGISTKESFENFHLQLEFKWGNLKWAPKKNNARDSGLLYHAVGPHGADGNFWMRSHEFQIQEGDCGDYWGVAGGTAHVPATPRGEKDFIYDPSGPMLLFSDKSETGRHCIKSPDAEKPSGEWNTIDLYCVGDTSVHVINSVVTMVLYQLAQQDSDRTTPMTKGKIQLQSEGAEIFYRNISIEKIRRIPQPVLDRK